MQNQQKYLTINAIFSQITGIIAILFSVKLNSFFSVSHDLVFPFIGMNLLGFSMFVLIVSKKFPHKKSLVKIISFLDIGWVLGSATIILLGLFSLSSKGYIVIAIIAIWIAFLAYKQLQYNK